MKPVNNKILVRVNLKQKDTMLIDGIQLSTATKFESNFREKSPVIAEVVSGNSLLKKGDIIVTHHNHFYEPSPYHLQLDLYSIPFNRTIFAKVSKNGKLSAMCGNIIGERVPIKTEFEQPVEHQKKYVDRLLITDRGDTSYKNGTTIICRPNAPYDIVLNWNGVEKRITKVPSDQVVGILLKK